jgi:hypothetical protein
MTHIAVIGGRARTDREFIETTLSTVFKEGDVLVSGGAMGVDTIGEEWAKRLGFAVVIYRPDYMADGKAAPLIRNHQIVEKADIVMAFPSERSKGTWHAVHLAWEMGKEVQIYG